MQEEEETTSAHTSSALTSNSQSNEPTAIQYDTEMVCSTQEEATNEEAENQLPQKTYRLLDWVVVAYQTKGKKQRWVYYVARIIGEAEEDYIVDSQDSKMQDDKPIESMTVQCYKKYMDPTRDNAFKQIDPAEYCKEEHIVTRVRNSICHRH